MILTAIRGQECSVQVTDDPAEIGVETLFERRVDERSSILRREYDVEENGGVTVRHGVRPMRMSRGDGTSVDCRPLRGLALWTTRVHPACAGCY